MTPDQLDFLNSDSRDRVVLAELSYHDGTEEKTETIGNHAFISTPTDTLPHIPYNETLKGIVITDTLGANSITGSITVFNHGLDHWLSRAWRGWPFKILVGSPTWNRDDFILIFSGLLGGMKATGTTIKFQLFDQRETLKVFVQENTLPNNQPVPLCFGNCFNLPAVLVNAGMHEYQCHESAMNSMVSVRDNGLPVAYTEELVNGKFTLNQSPFGDIRCDVLGQTTGATNEIFKELAKRTGLNDADFDASVDTFTEKQSLFIHQKRTIDLLLTDLCHSVGAYWFFNENEKLAIRKFEEPGVANHTLDPDDILGGGLSMRRIEQPVSKVDLFFNKNWGSQSPDQLSEILLQTDVDKFSSEYELISVLNSGVSDQYPLSKKRIINTLLTDSIEVQAEANRRATLRNQQRFIYKVVCFTSPFTVHVGDSIYITYDGFGFENGANAIVIKKTLRPSQNRVELEVWR